MPVSHKARSASLRIFFAILWFAPGVNAQDAVRWSVSPILGIHAPKLEALNKGEFHSPILGVGEARPELVEGETPGPDSSTGEAVTVAFGGPSNLPEIGPSSNAGLEFQWIQNEKHSFIFGASSWEGYTVADKLPMRVPLQGRLRDAIFDRRATVSYNEFFFGWRYNVFALPKKYTLYTRFSLNELFDIDYRESLVFSFADQRTDDPETNFVDIKRIFILDSQATGVMLLHFGVGGEYFLKKNLSLGFESGYSFQPSLFTLRPYFIDKDDQLGDGMTLFYPSLADSNNELRYVREDTQPSVGWSQSNLPPTSEMKLSFQGWKAAFRLNVYF